jgi:hypothetical protein
MSEIDYECRFSVRFHYVLSGKKKSIFFENLSETFEEWGDGKIKKEGGELNSAAI